MNFFSLHICREEKLEHECDGGNDGSERDSDDACRASLQVADGGALASSESISLVGSSKGVRIGSSSLTLGNWARSESVRERLGEIGDVIDGASEIVAVTLAEDAQGAELAVAENRATETTNDSLADRSAARLRNGSVVAVDCTSNDDANADVIASGELGGEGAATQSRLDLRVSEEIGEDIVDSREEIVDIVIEGRAAGHQAVAGRVAPLPGASNWSGGVVNAQNLGDEIRTADGAQGASGESLNSTEALGEVARSAAAEAVSCGVDLSYGSLELRNAVDLILLLLGQLAVGTNDINLGNGGIKSSLSLSDSSINIVGNSLDAIQSG